MNTRQYRIGQFHFFRGGCNIALWFPKQNIRHGDRKSTFSVFEIFTKTVVLQINNLYIKRYCLDVLGCFLEVVFCVFWMLV